MCLRLRPRVLCLSLSPVPKKILVVTMISLRSFFLENQTFEELGDVKALLTQPSSLITRPIWDSDYRGSTVSIRVKLKDGA